MESVKEYVLSYKKIAERLAKRPKDKLKILGYIKEMASNFSLGSHERVGKFLDLTLVRLYDGLDFQIPEGLDLNRLVKENHVVFVPNHQSHADYLLFNYMLFRRYRIAPRIAGGINLNVFPIGGIFRKSGCFFIRRSFHSNALYKLTIEAYISYLLYCGESVEFFYEGGRSRTGKLLSPKHGIYQILLETHATLPAKHKKNILFIPVSIVHEVVPEHQALVRELDGGKKKKESFSQMLHLGKFLVKKFGTVHVRVNKPVPHLEIGSDLKNYTKKLALECYKSVGQGMTITPSSVMALILLDSPSGFLTIENIFSTARPIIEYCKRFSVPLAVSLSSGTKQWQDSLKKALDFLIKSGKIVDTYNKKLKETYYYIDENARNELLYSKNAILHHFIVPLFINLTWLSIFNGTLKNSRGLRKFLLEQRELLAHEFYLPSLKELFTLCFDIIKDSTGKTVRGLDECLDFTVSDMYKVAERVSPFANSFRYIYEGYYVTVMALKHFKGSPFDREEFFKISKEIFKMEKAHGRFVKFSESCIIPTLRNALAYFIGSEVVISEGSQYVVSDQQKVEELVAKHARSLTEILTFNLQLHSDRTL